MRMFRFALGLLVALPLGAAWAQAPHPAASPTVPARIGTPVTPSPAPSTAAIAAGGKRIDVNSASEADLASLPGIGPVTAKQIVDGRPWDDLAELTKKKALNGPTLSRNKDRLALADINTSSAEMMAKTLPGIGEKTAPKIVAGRPYATPQDLVTKKVLTPAQFAKIKDVITY